MTFEKKESRKTSASYKNKNKTVAHSNNQKDNQPEFKKDRKFSGKKDFARNSDNKRASFKPRNTDKTRFREESRLADTQAHTEHVKRKGFSEFQLRLVTSILEDVLVMHNSLDRAYAFWFNKVKIDPAEQA